MPHVIVHAMMSCAHCMVHACRQAGHLYDFMACNKLIICLPFAPAKQHLLKLTTSHFNTLNMQIETRMYWKGFSLPCEMRTWSIAMRTSGYVERNM